QAGLRVRAAWSYRVFLQSTVSALGVQGGSGEVPSLPSEHALPEHRCCLYQSLCFKCIEILLDRFRWILQTLPMIPRGCRHKTGCEIEQMQDKLVRVDRLDSERFEDLRGKISQVHSDDHAGPPANGRCQNVPIVG